MEEQPNKVATKDDYIERIDVLLEDCDDLVLLDLIMKILIESK